MNDSSSPSWFKRVFARTRATPKLERAAPRTAGPQGAGRSAQAPDGNIPTNWKDDFEWVTGTWGPPRNAVVGEASYQSAIRKLVHRPRGGRTLRPADVKLSREPSNAFDENAVVATVDGERVGYLRRETARRFVEACKRNPTGPHSVVVAGVFRGGGPDRDIGIHVWPDKRLSHGPVIDLTPDDREVSWPPHDIEVEAGERP